MRNRTGIAVGLALALSLAAVLVQAAGAENRRYRGDSELMRQETFNVSGEFTGTLSGEIQLNGLRYQIGDNVQAYELGVGLLPPGSMISNRFVFMSGVRNLGSETIYSVIVRPATVPSLDQNGPGSQITIHTTAPEDE